MAGRRHRLAQRRRAVGYTQEQLAEQLGVERTTVVRWEAGATMPLPWQWPNLADALKVTSDDLIDLLENGRTSVVGDTHATLRAHFGRNQHLAACLGPLNSNSAVGGTVQPLTVAIAIVRNRARLLLVCRRDEAGGSWQFPAGVVKPGVDPAAVAVAETLAETGVHCRVAQHIGRRLHPVTQVVCEYFLCDYLTGRPDNRDPVENLTATWADDTDLTRFIPVGVIFPPILEALAEAI